MYDLFQRYAERDLDEAELACVDEMINRVFGHTLALQLIARQVKYSHISVAQATTLLREKGVSNIAPEKVDYVKDWRLYQDTVADIIGVIFQAGEMDEGKKAMLKAQSMFSVVGIGISTFSYMLSLDTKDPINELAREGWVQIDEDLVSLHPVVREVVRRWEWTELDQNVCGLVVFGIWKQIVMEAEKENLSRKQIQDMQMMKTSMQEDPKCDARIREYADGLGIEGDILLERIANSDQRQVKDYQKLRAWLNMAEEVLDSYRKEPGLEKTNLYYALLYQSFMNVPLEREDYILTHAREWLSVLSEDDWKQMDGKVILDLYNTIVKEIAQNILDSDLSIIDQLFIPWASMLFEFKEYEKAAEKFKEGIRLCEKDAYKSVVPYIRKKVDLYTCLLDAYYLKGDFEKCREVLGVIDEENWRNRELGVVKVIEEGYREEILRG